MTNWGLQEKKCIKFKVSSPSITSIGREKLREKEKKENDWILKIAQQKKIKQSNSPRNDQI